MDSTSRKPGSAKRSRERRAPSTVETALIATFEIAPMADEALAGEKSSTRFSAPAAAAKLLVGEPWRAAPVLQQLGEAIVRSLHGHRVVSFRVHVSPYGEIAVTPLDETDAEEVAFEEPGDNGLAAALAEARQRGDARAAEILASPDMLGADAFARLLGTTRMTVNTWRRYNRVLALRGAKRGFRYPAWQVSKDGKPFAALPALFERLGGAWGVYLFLVQHQPQLDGLTGLEALRRGRTARVIDAANAIAQGDFT